MTEAAAKFDRLCRALDGAGDIGYEWDLQNDRIHWFAGSTAVDDSLALDSIHSGADLEELVLAEDRTFRADKLAVVQRSAGRYELEYRLRCTDGRHRWFHDRGAAEISSDGEPVSIFGVLRPIDVDENDGTRFGALANFDALTGQYNRTRLRDSLEHALHYARRYETAAAFMAIGIDKLAVVNQAFGSDVADDCIVTVSDVLEQSLRASDVVGRLEGDIFGVVLAQCPEGDMAATAEKILDAVRNTPIETPEGPIHVTVSIGAVAVPHGIKSATDVIQKADLALREAKQAGRDTYSLHQDTGPASTHRREQLMMAEKIQAAIREERLTMAFQPIVDSQTRVPVLHECLLRMIEPNGQVVAAGKFIHVAEELGLIRPIDRLMLEKAVRCLEEHPTAKLALNVSGLTTTDRVWLRSVVKLLRDRRDIAERLVVEITETAGLEDVDACARFVSTLRELGCEVALDDFGAGYTSFRHLKKLAVNMVKIDGSFVRDIQEHPDNLVFIRTLIDLAKNFGLDTVAECVENEEEALILAEQGVHYLQGYWLGMPVLDAPWTPADADIPDAATDATPVDADAAVAIAQPMTSAAS